MAGLALSALTLTRRQTGPLTRKLQEAKNALAQAFDNHRGCPICAALIDPFDPPHCDSLIAVEEAQREVWDAETMVSSKKAWIKARTDYASEAEMLEENEI